MDSQSVNSIPRQQARQEISPVTRCLPRSRKIILLDHRHYQAAAVSDDDFVEQFFDPLVTMVAMYYGYTKRAVRLCFGSRPLALLELVQTILDRHDVENPV